MIPQDESEELLQAGIAAAQSGQRVPARALLREVTEHAPDNAMAWLWLSEVVDDIAEQATCLEHILALEPGNAKVRDRLASLRQQQVEMWLRDGIAAAEVGRPERARAHLMHVLEHDEENVAAWFWLGKVLTSPDEQIICFENVLTLDPGHAEAAEALAKLKEGDAKRKYASLASEILEEDFAQRDLETETTATEPVIDAPTPAYVSEAAAVLGPGFAARYTLPGEYAAPVASRDVLDNPYLCPYCASPTEPEDRKCAVCGGALWSKQRRRVEKEAFRLRWLPLFEAGALLLNAGFLWVLLISIGMRVGLGVEMMFGIYLRGAEPPPELLDTLFEALPRSMFWLCTMPLILSVLMLIGLILSTVIVVRTYVRRPGTFFVLQVLTVLKILAALGMLAFVITGGFSIAQKVSPETISIDLILLDISRRVINFILWGLAISNVLYAGMMFVLFRGAVDEYWVDEKRILLRLDKDVQNSQVGLQLRGKLYYENRMWALAALHLRKAAALKFNRDPALLVSLIATYMQLKRYDLASNALAEAQRVAPNMPEVQELAAMLDKRTGEEHRI